MKYLYGDATPFPLEENFIETISAATRACTALFALDMELAERRSEARAVAEQCDEEISRLTTLARSVEAALAPHSGEERGTATQGAAQSIAQQAASILKNARMEVLQRRDTSLRSTAQLNMGERMLAALQPFTLNHQLPKTTWFVRWRGNRPDTRADLLLTSNSACSLQTGFRAEIPEANRWRAPVRVDALVPGIELKLQHRGGLLSKSRPVKKAIRSFYITQVETTTEQAWFELKKNPAKASIGYEVVIRATEPSRPLIYAIDVKDERVETLTLTGADASALLDLWKTIAGELSELVDQRRELISARLRGTDIANLEEPAELGETMLMALAPILREIRIRSRVPGELVLKRDLGDGRREELFVPRRELEAQFLSLPYEYRAYFSAVGLGSEATSEFIQREYPLQIAPDTESNATLPARDHDPEPDGENSRIETLDGLDISAA